jgi:superfamily II DNA or RNA helicase
MTRDERQQQFIDLFISKEVNGKGTLEATPAFGKTRCATKIIKFLRRTEKTRKVIVVVPQHFLKKQWEAVLSSDPDLYMNTEVVVINSVIRGSYSCSLLILDEIHRYASDTFSKVFGAVKYRFVLGLTATIKRLDKKHTLLITHCPIIDRVSTEEAAIHGWISPYMEFNLRVDLSPADLADYQKSEEYYQNMIDLFAGDYGLMMRVSREGIKPRRSGVSFLEPAAVILARKRGWKGNSAYQAWKAMTDGNKDYWGGNKTHPFHPVKLHICAINGTRQMAIMKKYINNSEGKLKLAVELCTRIPVKTITFSSTIKRTDALTKALGTEALSYHSKVAKKGLTKENALKQLIEKVGKNEVRIINTAKALDEGADFPDIRMGIRLEGTSSPTQHIQRRGRIVRKFEGKSAVMINLYLFGTRETIWLSNAQGYSEDIIWVDTIEELMDQIVVT